MKKCLLALFLLAAPEIPAAQFFQDFSAASIGATDFGDGSEVVSEGSAAGVQGAALKELRLIPQQPNTRAAFLAPALDAGKKILAFSAKWNASMIFDSADAGDGFQSHSAILRRPMSSIPGIIRSASHSACKPAREIPLTSSW